MDDHHPPVVQAEHRDRHIIEPQEVKGYEVLFIALPTVDATRALKRLLKYSLRVCGLRAKSVTPRGTR